MRKYLIALALSVSLAGCGSLGDALAGSSLASQAPAVTAKSEQALTVMHYAYEEIGDVILAAVKSGALHGDNAAKVKRYYDAAGDALKIADKADEAANEKDLLAALSDAGSAIFSIKQLVGK